MDAARPTPDRPATSTDVARESGVSRTTVSYVLNDTPNRQISAATRELVLETARRLGHVPNPQARALRKGSSNIVVCLVPALTLGYVFDRALDLLTRELSAMGYALLVHRMSDVADASGVTEIWGYLTPKLVVTIGNLPVASTEKLQERSPVPVVSDLGVVEHRRIGLLQAEYLITQGHTQLAFLMSADPALHAYAVDRLEGVRDSCERASLAAPVVATVDLSIGDAIRVANDLIGRGVTAVCCHNDDVALVLLAAVREIGKSAPSDLAVIGSDNIPLAQAELTTIALDIDVCAARISSRVMRVLGSEREAVPAGEMLRLVRRRSA